jgi:diguanylate cyclase (GGDEF)-like protein/PAS domain S-box-containing protein
MPLPIKPSHLLVVEDDLLTAKHIQLQLMQLGYASVDIAHHGEAALALAQQHCPGLVLMDIDLNHEMDGIEIAEKMRQQFDLPIIFLTAHADVDVLTRAKLVKPAGYMLKPFSARELHAMVEMAFYKHHAEKKMHELAQQNQAMLDNMMDGLICINIHGVVESINPAAATMFGYTQAEVMGNNVSMLMPEPHHSHHDGYLKHFQQGGEARIIGHPRELEGKRKDGSIFPITLAVTQTHYANHRVFIGVIRDITRLRHDESEIRRLAFYDDLTGLPNRRLLLDRLRHAMLTSQRTGLHGAVLLLDLDHFKQINDTMGHDVGDELLRQTSMRLQSRLREGDSVARLGGDEFAILLENLSQHDHEAARQAETIAKKVLDALTIPYQLGASTHQISTSIGIVAFVEERDAINDLLKKADVAMYQAKSAGRNTVRFFDPAMQELADAYVTLKQAMQQGIIARQFVLHYQIQVDCARQITGVEALIRWHHPEQGMMAPGAFIPLAEESGLILPLGQWVLEEACRQLVAWSAHPVQSGWSISVNVSASQFAHPDFVAHVHTALRTTGAPPGKLKLELTESMLVTDADTVIAKMKAILAAGIQFSLDDFGTGYSCLSYLKRLPLAQLKIDQSFVRDILLDASDAMIVHTILALGHNLNMQVIAEGVETAQQVHLLEEIGCDRFQGYFFGRPCPPEQLPLQL